MPRYFFNALIDGDLGDDEGVELRDLTAARHEAAVLVGQLLKDNPSRVYERDGELIAVSDSSGSTLFTLKAVVQAAAPT